MFAEFTSFFAGLQVPPVYIAMVGSGLGALLIVVGLAGSFRQKDPVLRRMEAVGRPRGRSVENGLLQPVASDPRGMSRVLVPTDQAERSRVLRQLLQAGITGPNALRNYYLLRIGFGIVLPLLLVLALTFARSGIVQLPPPVTGVVASIDNLRMIQVIGVLVGIGFFAPAAWLERRARHRQQAIEEAFPNALDLLQVAVDAGLGLDAAMVRVANEIMHVAPEIASEILATQREIQAGRNRDRALFDMADRTQVEEVRAFVNVLLQSARFGTNVSDVLNTYSKEMRLAREMKAQEMANKLPVKMSAVLAMLMLPALLMIALGPVVIRYMHVFGNGFGNLN